MNRNDPDLAAVHDVATQVAGAAAQPTPDDVARTLARVTITGDSGRPAPPGNRFARRWSGRVLVPAGAAAAVVAVLLTTLVLRPGPGADSPIGAAPAPTAATTIAPTKSEPVKRPAGTADPAAPTVTATDFGDPVGTVPMTRVINEMVARSGSVVPADLTAGQLIYHLSEVVDKSTVPGTPVTTSVHELWFDPNGMAAVRNVIDGRETGEGAPSTGGPSLSQPTPEFLAGLPTNPATLYDMLKELNVGVKLGGARYVLKELGSLFRSCNLVLTAPVRAALYRVLGQLPGMSATEVNLAGRKLYRVHQSGVNATDLLLDPATGRVAGGRWSSDVDGGTADTIDLWRYAVVDSRDQRPGTTS